MAKDSSRRSAELTPSGMLLRALFALVLVLITFNPSGWSFFHWVRDAMIDDALGPKHFFVGAVFACGWAVLLIATARSLGMLGITLGAVMIGTFIWMMTDWGLLAADSATSITWIALVCLAILLSLGLCWSHVWRRITGQVNVDDVND